jgi:hypothetical protein
MRTIASLWTVAIAAWAVALLGGCSGNGSSGMLSPSFETTLPAQSGVPNGVVNDALKKLAVSDLGGGTILSRIEFLNQAYQFVGTITDGIDGATGDWYDNHGNLYVGNYAVPMVQEYAKGKTVPTFTYSSGLERPYSVATDAGGHVFVADEYNPSGSGGGVLEYSQGSNTALAQCLNSLNDTGVAVDGRGDVFVSGADGSLLEYKHGLSSCNAQKLGVTLPGGGGLQIDKSGDLVACAGRVVDVVPRPYKSISLAIGGFQSAAHDALSKDQSLLFVADPGNYDVQVLSFPKGSYLTTLGVSNGLIDPIGVAVYPATK